MIERPLKTTSDSSWCAEHKRKKRRLPSQIGNDAHAPEVCNVCDFLARQEAKRNG